MQQSCTTKSSAPVRRAGIISLSSPDNPSTPRPPCLRYRPPNSPARGSRA
ncbi:hypothetical protein NY78_1668 [Desulfovibrio sp. TomC]|nr:hypothetical protein NY78_1668 [Desulfovibrio sp. TomC]